LDGGTAHRDVSTYIRLTEQRKSGHASILRAGLELRNSVFEWLKTIRSLDYAATGTVLYSMHWMKCYQCNDLQ